MGHKTPFQRSKCLVCNHKDRTLIEQSRLSGLSLDALAGKYAVSRDSIHRHCRDHIDDELRASLIAAIPLKELAERATAEGLSLLDYLALIRGTLTTEFQLAASLHDRNGTAILAGRLLQTVQQMSVLTGELARINPALNVTNNTAIFVQSPAFHKLHELLLKELRDYPEVLSRLLDGLRALDVDAVPLPPMIEATAGASA